MSEEDAAQAVKKRIAELKAISEEKQRRDNTLAAKGWLIIIILFFASIGFMDFINRLFHSPEDLREIQREKERRSNDPRERDPHDGGSSRKYE
jgi:hypothetical protein